MRRDSSLARWLALVVLFACGAAPLPVVAADVRDQSKEIKRGYDAIRSGKYDEAAERFSSAIEKAPDSADARLGLALAFLKTRRFYAAVEQSVNVLEKTPDHARANALVGMVLMRIGLLNDAKVYFLKSLAANEREPLAHAGVAELELYSGNLKEALRRARLAVSGSSRDPDFLYLLGQCSARQEAYAEAAKAYEDYLRFASDLDSDRRARIRGLIQLYRRLSNRTLYLVTGAKSADIAITFPDARLPFVDVKVNGQGPFRFVIDTGAGFVVVSKRLAKKLKMRPVASGGTSRGVSGNGRFTIVYGIIDKLAMGPMTMQNVPTYIREIRDSEENPIDGYIGLSVLGQFQVAVDYDRKLLELRPPGTPPAPLVANDVEVPFSITNGGMLSVPVDIGKEIPLNFIVDTGASSTVVSTKAYERFNLQEKEHKGVTVRVIGAGGVTDNVPIVVLDRLALHGYGEAREFVRAVVLDLEPVNEAAGFEQAGIIGNDVLRFYRVEFNFARGSLVLRRHRSDGGTTEITAVQRSVS